MDETGEHDAFEQYLQASHGVTSASGGALDPPAKADAGDYLRLLAESSLRQEKLLTQMTQKLSELTLAQEALANRLNAGVPPPPSSHGVAGAYPAQKQSVPRGGLVHPPGKALTSSATIGSPEDLQAQTDRMVAERQKRLEEEGRRRAEDLVRQRAAEEDQRRREAERTRMEEEKAKEEERKRKEALQDKTSGLMNDLLTSSAGGGGGLFDESPRDKKKSSLFDD